MTFTRSSTAAIYGLSGAVLTGREKSFLNRYRPLGVILFARNIVSPEQLKAYIDSIRQATGEELLVLIDQEGGRVARLKPPHWPEFPPAGRFAALYRSDPEKAKEALYLNYRAIAHALHAAGINVNCAPMLDVLFERSHAIIGDRALGTDPQQIIDLAREAIRGLEAGGVLPVIKHIPGHGRATLDSHEALPLVTCPKAELQSCDFAPFKALNGVELGMTAHITYEALDPLHCATESAAVIDIIRNDIGFDGLLMTDDLSMKALKGGYGERAEKSLAAGCDVVLHCNGGMDEMLAVAERVPECEGAAKRRLDRAFAKLTSLTVTACDTGKLLSERDRLLAA